MPKFEKGNKVGNRFTSDNQPKKTGRKPSLFKQIKILTGKKVGFEMGKEDYLNVIRFLMEQPASVLEKLVKANPDTPIWVMSVISAINADVRYGRTSTLEMLFDRVFGKAEQTINGEINANLTNSVDFSALSTDELIQLNALQDKMRAVSNKPD